LPAPLSPFIRLWRSFAESEAKTTPGSGAAGFACCLCYQEEGGGLLGASGDCYLMLHGRVRDEVRAICDELWRREAKPSIWA